MKGHMRAIFAILRKDLLALVPLVATALAVFILAPVIASLDLKSDPEAWTALKSGFYYLSYFMAMLLMVSVVHQDPAASVTHDWLARPIFRLDLMAAKLLFLLVTICIPVVLGRVFVNLVEGYSLAEALSHAAAIEKLPALLPVPFLFAAALLTSTLKKTIGLVVAIAVILILPGWDLPRPLFSLLGIDFTNSHKEALTWLQAIPLVALGVGSAAILYSLIYSRRSQAGTRFVTYGTAVLLFFCIYPPRWVYDWDAAIAIHEMLINDGGESTLEEGISLDHEYACFPAFEVGDSLETEKAKLAFVDANWGEYHEALLETGAVAFQTRVNVRGLPTEWFSASVSNREVPVDWRVHRIRTRGSYHSATLDGSVAIQRAPNAVNRASPIAPARADYWLAPAEVSDLLAVDNSTQLLMDYDLALLAPTAYELPVDGRRHAFSKLGHCRALRNAASNEIKVECTKRGPQPALVSAELIGVKSSRVDSSPWPNYKSPLLEYLTRKDYELSIASPDLVESSSVMVTAWELEHILQKQLVSDGFLGDSPRVCPPPAEQDFVGIEKSQWSDRSPHQISFVTVEPGVRLEVLDWRSEAQTQREADLPTLVMLPGLGATAHSFDDLAPRLAKDYPVIAITRRGTGESAKPSYGYTTDRLGQDVLQVLETLGIKHPILVGHSIGGEELSYLGAHHPERINGLVYLDAAYDRSGTSRRYKELSKILPPAPPPHPAEMVSYDASHAYAKRIGASNNLPAGEILASYDLVTGESKLPSIYLEAIAASVEAPDYQRITIPSLAIYALETSADSFANPWFNLNSPAINNALQEMFELQKLRKERDIARFDEEVANSDVIILEDADHWIFLSHEDEVVQAIDTFVASREWQSQPGSELLTKLPQ